MAWDILPILLTDAQAYAFAIQHWKAIQERAFVQGQDNFPEEALPWDTGTVTGFNAGTGVLTDSTKAWAASPQRWNNFTPPPLTPYVPSFYDVVIEVGGDTDPIKVVRCFIGGNMATTLTGLNFDNYVAQGIIGNTSELVGKKYYIVKSDGPWWSDRWPDFPNAWLFSFGKVSTSTTTSVTDDARTPGSTSMIRRPPWAPARWAAMLPTDPRNTAGGFDLIWREGSTWRRAAITSNTGDTLTIASTSPAPAANSVFAIIDHGGIWRSAMSIDLTTGAFDYNPKPASMGLWYAGVQENWFSNDVDDVMRLAQLAAATVQYETPSGPGDACQLETFPAFDIDVRIPIDSECETARAGDFLAVNFWKSYRALQLWLENNSPNWIEKKDYDGATAVPAFRTASWFKKAGINGFSTTISSVSSTTALAASFTLPGAPTPFDAAPTSADVFYVIFNDVGDIQTAGVGTITATTLTDSDGGPFDNTRDTGRTLIYSWSWTRDYPREFRYLYPKTYFIPDTDDDDAAVVPPEDNPGAVPPRVYPGTWITRAASTHYAEHDSRGFVVDSGPAFLNGEAARYKGDNFSDPTTPVMGPGTHGDTVFYQKAYDGQHPQATQALIDSAKSGTATGGSDRMLEDTAKAWWNLPPWGGGTMRAETGTATGGSSTTLSDTTKSTSAFWNAGTGRWAGFILEVTKTVSGLPVIFRTPILSMAGTTLTFSAVGGLTVAAADPYTIREPAYELNRWKDRHLKVTKLDGTTAEFFITHSDDQRLYFAPQAFSIVAGMNYEIVERPHGTVWLRVAGDWVIPAGNDSRTGVPWLADQKANLPTRVRKYGRRMRGDYNSFVSADEMFRGINALVWTKKDFDWTGNSEDNHIGWQAATSYEYGSGKPYGTYDDAYGALMTSITDQFNDDADFDAPHVLGSTNAPPNAELSSGAESGEQNGNQLDGVGVVRGTDFVYDAEYAYATISGIPTKMNSTVDFMAYGAIDSLDSPQAIDANWVPTGSGQSWQTVYHENKFDANGSPLVYHEFIKVDSIGPSNTATRTSSTKVGNVVADVPAFEKPPAPVPHQHDADSLVTPADPSIITGAAAHINAGFYVLKSTAIIKWDVSGGLKYVAAAGGGEALSGEEEFMFFFA